MIWALPPIAIRDLEAFAPKRRFSADWFLLNLVDSGCGTCAFLLISGNTGFPLRVATRFAAAFSRNFFSATAAATFLLNVGLGNFPAVRLGAAGFEVVGETEADLTALDLTALDFTVLGLTVLDFTALDFVATGVGSTDFVAIETAAADFLAPGAKTVDGADDFAAPFLVGFAGGTAKAEAAGF